MNLVMESRKRMYFVSVSIVICHLAIAQFNNKIDNIDFYSGIAVTKFKSTIENAIDPGKNIGLLIGAGASFLDHTYWNLSANIAFCQKTGVESSYIVDNNSGFREDTKKFYLNYLGLNTTINFRYPIYDLITPFIRLGPRMEYLIIEPKELYNELKRINYGLVYGAGIEKIYSRRISVILEGSKNFNCNKIYAKKSESSDDQTILFDIRVRYKLTVDRQKVPPSSVQSSNF